MFKLTLEWLKFRALDFFIIDDIDKACLELEISDGVNKSIASIDLDLTEKGLYKGYMCGMPVYVECTRMMLVLSQEYLAVMTHINIKE